MSSPPTAQDPVTSGRMTGLSRRGVELLERVGRAIDRRDMHQADEALVAVLALAPNHPEVLRLLGVAYLLVGRAGDAVETLRRALALRPGDPLILNNLGCAERGNGDPDAAIMTLRKACTAAPTLASAWHNLGQTLKGQAHTGDAYEAFGRALELAPGHIDARIGYANTLKALGRIDAAAGEYRVVLGRRPASAEAWLGLANIKTVRFSAAEAAAMQSTFERLNENGEDRAQLGFALAAALEDQDRYADAFAMLNRANAARREQVPWDAAAFTRGIDAIANAFSVAPNDEGTRGAQAIFIVSLPRSGSTLVEQIISAHPQVEGAGELPDLAVILDEESKRRGCDFTRWASDADAADWKRLGEDYLERTARWRRSCPRFTDKALMNWQFVGAAARMLPGARFIDCRRDPLETCLSCYRQWFAEGQGYSYDLDALAAFWHDYARLMQHWSALWPGRIHRQGYEALIADPQAEVRRLLKACNLEFDPACLDFHRNERPVRTASAAQVRQPLRRDTARAARYGVLLDPLRAALAAQRSESR